MRVLFALEVAETVDDSHRVRAAQSPLRLQVHCDWRVFPRLHALQVHGHVVSREVVPRQPRQEFASLAAQST